MTQFVVSLMGRDPDGFMRVEHTLPLTDRTLIGPVYLEWRLFRLSK